MAGINKIEKMNLKGFRFKKKTAVKSISLYMTSLFMGPLYGEGKAMLHYICLKPPTSPLV